MGEITGTAEPTGQAVQVAVDEKHVGLQFQRPGESFDISSVVTPHPNVGADRFSRVYFKTRSGNIYRISERGNLLDGRRSQQEQRQARTALDVNVLKQMKLTVGQPFRYGSLHTTEVSEIVAASDREYDAGYLRQMTNGRTTTIRSDLVRMLPHEPAKPAPVIRR